MIMDHDPDLGFTAGFDSIYEIKLKQHKFHMKIKFNQIIIMFKVQYMTIHIVYIRAIIDNIKSNQI